MRLTKEQLDGIKKKYNVDELWSFSKFDCYRTSHYEWFLKYILKKEHNNPKQSAYGIVGGLVHDIIENMYNGKIKREELLETFQQEWMTSVGLLDLYFNRNDSDKNNSIRQKYYDDIELFCKNYKMLDYKMVNESFIAIKITNDIVFQGYIDAIYKDENNIVTIIDYKTSTKYSGKAIDEHADQLLLYAEGLRQLGVPKENIRVCWNFLKYCTFTFTQKNGKVKERIIERNDLYNKVQNTISSWLKDEGYNETEINSFIEDMLFYKTFDLLPEVIKGKFELGDCYVYVDDIWDKVEVLKQNIIDIIAEINYKKERYLDTSDERIFWDSKENLEKNNYYYSNLCEYSIPTMKPFQEYLEDLELDSKEETLESDDVSDIMSLLGI